MIVPVIGLAMQAVAMPQHTGTEAEYRGLSVAGTQVVWATARNGVFSRTDDGGRTWYTDTIPGGEGLFLVDVHAVDAVTACVLGTSFDGGLARIYHTTVHGGLDGLTPIARYQQDLNRIRPLGLLAEKLDALFLHRHNRKVRKDATVSFNSQCFEVPYELTGKTIIVVVDPHTEQPLSIESKSGESLGKMTPLDAVANNQRRRCRPEPQNTTPVQSPSDSTVELAYEQFNKTLQTTLNDEEV